MRDEFFGRQDRSGKDFDRRERAAFQGRHFPTPVELVLGMVFFRDSFESDLGEFMRRLEGAVRAERDHEVLARLSSSMKEVQHDATATSLARLQDSLVEAESTTGLFVAPYLLRCRYYMAYRGNRDAVLDLACDAVTMVLSNDATGVVERRLFWRALDFLLVAAQLPGFNCLGPGERLNEDADSSIQRLDAFDFDFRPIVRRALAIADDGEEAPARTVEGRDPLSRQKANAGDGDHGTNPGKLVIADVGAEIFPAGTSIAERYRHIAGRRLPLTPARPALEMERELVLEFPHAAPAIQDLLCTFGKRGFASFEPTILVGPPGAGKTRLARRLMEAGGLQNSIIPCGGMSDSAIGGTARKWQSGEPSLPMRMITKFEVASFGIVLDEIDKVGTSRANGQVHDALLVFLEPETASRFFDPYLQAECDLSAVSWIMTANDLDLLPRTLRERSRVVSVPAASSGDLDRLARGILVELLARRGEDIRWAAPFDPLEMQALRDNWQGGSLRVLLRMIEVIIEQRQRPEKWS